jgi:hypothetical protein
LRAFSLFNEPDVLLGVEVREPAENRGNVAGCYGLMIGIALTVAGLVALGFASPEKDDLDIEISARQ